MPDMPSATGPVQREPPALADPHGRSRARWIWAGGAVLVVAAALRLAGLLDVPPGLQHDEVFGAVFAESVFAGRWSLFFDANGGNEPLFLYLVTAAMGAFGRNALALRLPAVAGGLISIAGLLWVQRRLFGPQVALLAGLLMSFSIWHLLDSRVSLRAIWLPALLTLSYGFLWRWLAQRRARWLLLGAGLLGLSLYTYTSAALGTATVLLFAVWLLFWGRDRSGGAGLALAAALAALVGLPLALHVAGVPEASLRLRALSAELLALRSGDPVPMLKNVPKVLGMFAFTGDPEWRYNVAGRPVFSLPLGALFYLGLLVCFRRRRQGPYAFLLLWLGVNLGASLVTGSAPSSLRAVGAAPAVFALAALGALAGAGLVRGRASGWGMAGKDAATLSRPLGASARRWAAAAALAPGLLLALVVAWEVAASLRGYFLVWPANDGVRAVYLADLATIARYLGRTEWPGPVMISSEFAADLDRQSFEYLGFTRRPDARWFDGQRSLVLPSQPTLVFFPRQRPPADALRPYLPRQATGPPVLEKDFEAWVLEAPAESEAVPLAQAVTAWAAPALAVEAVHMPESVAPGEELRTVVEWTVTAQAPGGHSLSFFGHLRDAQGLLWSQVDVLTYSTSDWRVGDRVLQVLLVAVPPDMPPGQVSLQVGLYENAAQPLTLLLPPDGTPFWRLEAGKVRVVGGAPCSAGCVSPEQRLALDFGKGLALIGTTVDPRLLQPGGTFEASLWWQVEPGATPGDLSFDLESEGGSIALADQPVLAGVHVRATAILRDRHLLRLPREAERGTWRLVVSGGAPETRRVDLGEVFVGGVERTYVVPKVSLPLAARLGETAELVGADVEGAVAPADGRIVVRIVWRCLEPTDEAYTVFLHLLAPDGSVVRGADAQPGAGTRATTGWLPGEVIVDEHVLDLAGRVPPGHYRLVAGLYRADLPGYPRLPVAGSDSDYVLIAEVEVGK